MRPGIKIIFSSILIIMVITVYTEGVWASSNEVEVPGKGYIGSYGETTQPTDTDPTEDTQDTESRDGGGTQSSEDTDTHPSGSEKDTGSGGKDGKLPKTGDSSRKRVYGAITAVSLLFLLYLINQMLKIKKKS